MHIILTSIQRTRSLLAAAVDGPAWQFDYNVVLTCRRNIMETKTARLTVLVDPVKKKAFEELCAAQDLTPSQVVRQLIRGYLDKHGVSYGTQSQPKSDKAAARKK